MTPWEPVSPLPQEKGQESWGMPGQVENYRAWRMDSGIFQACERAVGARVLSHLRRLSVLLVVLASFLARGLAVFCWVTSHSEEEGEGFQRGLRSKTIL